MLLVGASLLAAGGGAADAGHVGGVHADPGTPSLVSGSPSEDAPALSFADARYSIGERMVVSSENRAESSAEATAGFRYFGRLMVEGSEVDESNLRFAVESQSRNGSYELCELDGVCHPVGFGVDEDTGLLYLLLDGTNGAKHRSHLADYPEQTIEVSVTDTEHGLKVYQEILVRAWDDTPDCSDYPDVDRMRYTCLFLRESPLKQLPETTSSLQEGLPNLVQPSENYRLIFAEEFNDTAESGECDNGMITLNPEIWNYDTNPCNDVDTSGVLCNNVENGYFHMAKAANCGVYLNTRGKFTYKYGYLEVRYTVEITDPRLSYQNMHLSIGDHHLPLLLQYRLYGLTLDSYENITRYLGATINVFEWIPTDRHDVSHQYTNHKYADHYRVWDGHYDDTVPHRSTKNIYYYPPSVAPSNLDGLFFCPSSGCYRGDRITLTKGLEWTPRGYRTFLKVDGEHDDFIVVPQENIGVQRLSPYPANPNHDHSFSYRELILSDADRDRYFEYLIDEDDGSVLERIGISHVPGDLDMSAWGYSSSDDIRTRTEVDYIRIFQPENLYADMEPVYQ